MGRLNELSDLSIYISPTEEGFLLSLIIRKSETLVSLSLYSSMGVIAVRGLLIPIAVGCPNLKVLKCKVRDGPKDEICYFLRGKKHQLVTYEHHGELVEYIFSHK
jgi:hypothetical protein